MKNQLTKYWKPLAATIFWGSSFIATKFALSEVNPLQLIFLRLIIAAALLTFIAIITKRDFSIKAKSHSWILLLALVAVFHLWIQVTGLQFTSASNTGWIIGTAPVFMALLGFFFIKESLTFPKLMGIVIAFLGVLMLISHGNFANINFLKNKGDFLILGSSFTWGVYSIINKKVSLNYSPLMTILYLFLTMVVIISPIVLGKEFIHTLLQVSFNVWMSILFLGIFCSGISYVLWAQSLREMEAAKVGAFLYFEPFVTVIAAWLILNERITFLMMISGIIITIGVLLVNLNAKQVHKFWKKRSSYFPFTRNREEGNKNSQP